MALESTGVYWIPPFSGGGRLPGGSPPPPPTSHLQQRAGETRATSDLPLEGRRRRGQRPAAQARRRSLTWQSIRRSTARPGSRWSTEVIAPASDHPWGARRLSARDRPPHQSHPPHARQHHRVLRSPRRQQNRRLRRRRILATLMLIRILVQTNLRPLWPPSSRWQSSAPSVPP